MKKADSFQEAGKMYRISAPAGRKPRARSRTAVGTGIATILLGVRPRPGRARAPITAKTARFAAKGPPVRPPKCGDRGTRLVKTQVMS
ncbi:hypothetical protein GCM10009800_28470 [Nocardiopsis rhodophaea]